MQLASSSKDYFNNVLTTLNVVLLLLSMDGQKALGFHQKYLYLGYEGLTGLERHEGK